MNNQALKEMAEKMERIDKQREIATPRTVGLNSKLERLQLSLTETLIKEMGGARVSKDLERLRAEISETERAIAEDRLLIQGLNGAKAALVREKQALKLGIAEARYRELVPELQKLIDEWFEVRNRIKALSTEITQKQHEAGRYRMTSHELRNQLGLGPVELPGYQGLSWGDSSHHISVEQLKGEKSW